MTEPTTTRPRPRPRPRPRLVASDSTNDASSSTPGAPSSSSTTIPLTIGTGQQIVIEVNNSDDMFIRNANRTYQQWQKLDKLDRAASEARKPKAASSDSDDGTSPRKHHKNKRVKQEPSRSQSRKQLSKYTGLASADLSDDSDLEVVGESSSADDKPNGKRKRQQRSRSRSITPPPAVPLHQIQNARNLVRQALESAPRPPSPTFDDSDEPTDTIALQPEIKAIAQEIKRQSERQISQAPEASEEDKVTVTVKWHKHPLSKVGPKPGSEWQIDRTDTFRELFEAVAEEGMILSSNLIMTYHNIRIFPSVTPEILKIWTDNIELEAYEALVYEYIHDNAAAALRQPVAPSPPPRVNVNPSGVIEIDTDDSSSDHHFAASRTPHASTITAHHNPSQQQQPANTHTHTQESDAESEAEGEKLKLTIQSSLGKDISLVVRRTTKCGAIVKAYLKKIGEEEQYPDLFNPPAAQPASAPAPAPAKRGRGRPAKGGTPAAAPVPPAPAGKIPQLCIEGEKMSNDVEVGDDVEDGDRIDVVGL